MAGPQHSHPRLPRWVLPVGPPSPPVPPALLWVLDRWGWGAHAHGPLPGLPRCWLPLAAQCPVLLEDRGQAGEGGQRLRPSCRTAPPQLQLLRGGPSGHTTPSPWPRSQGGSSFLQLLVQFLSIPCESPTPVGSIPSVQSHSSLGALPERGPGVRIQLHCVSGGQGLLPSSCHLLPAEDTGQRVGRPEISHAPPDEVSE